MTEDSTELKSPVPAAPPRPDPVLEALRLELLELVQAPRLDARVLNRLAQVATAGSNLIAARNPKQNIGRRLGGYGQYQTPVSIQTYSMGESLTEGENAGYDAPAPEGDEGDEGALSPAPKNETYAVRLVRELVSTLPAMLVAHRDTPAALVSAIADARRNGMIDLACVLEERLGCKLGPQAPRPVTAPEPQTRLTAEDYVNAAAGAALGAAVGADTKLYSALTGG